MAKEIDSIEILKRAEETMFSVSGMSYQKALKIQQRLKKFKVEAFINPGGLCIYPKNTVQKLIMDIVCKNRNVKPYAGVTAHMADVIASKRG